MTDKIKPEFNDQAAHEPNDSCAHVENNRCAPAKENNLCTPAKEYIGPAEEKDTTKQTETFQLNETFQKQIIDLINDFSKWCDKACDNLEKWLEKAGPKLDKTLQKHGKNLSKLMVKTALVLAALTAQVKKETHEPELGDTKAKTTWTASTLGIHAKLDTYDGNKDTDFNFRMPLAETANELVRDELPNIDKAHEPEPIKNGAWKTTRELLRDNSAQTTETSMYEAEGTKDITSPQTQALNRLKDKNSR